VTKKVGQKLASIVERASHHFLTLAGALIVVLALVIAYSVVKRYVFHAPDPYAYEVSAMISLWCVVLAVPALEMSDRHIRMDLAIGRFPAGAKRIILKVVGPILALFYCSVLAWKGFTNAFYALGIGELSSSPWAVPLSPIKFVVPIGYSLLCLVLILMVIRGIMSLKDSSQNTKE
jgi:TRAP-type C4-dicarboxylate transport system permease small subunit